MNALIDEIYRFTPSKKPKTRNIKSLDKYMADTSGLIKPKDTKFEINPGMKNWHLMLFLCLIVIVFFIFVARTANLQILKTGTYSSLAENNKTRRAIVEAERGVIFDKNNEVLVRNKPAFAIELNPMLCRSNDASDVDSFKLCKEIVKKLSEEVLIDTQAIYEKLQSESRVVVLASGLTKEEVLPIESNLFRYPGLVVSVRPERDYILGAPFAHVLGYISLDDESLEPRYVGKSGIEKSYNNDLTGVFGSKIIEIDSTGQSFVVVAEEDALPGKNIKTFIDKDLQIKAYELLKERIDNDDNNTDLQNTTGGTVIAQDPKTGGILALVSYPSFEPNKMVSGLKPDEFEALMTDPGFPFFNRAISATYPPGSTFKMVVASGALEEGVITENTSIFDPGYISVSGFVFKNWAPGGHGDVSLIKALQKSNDTYFYTVGGGYGGVGGLGIERLYKWAKKFGFGSYTGIDIEGEEAGFMPDGTGREWYLGDTFITSIGQGDVLSTPLQVNNYATYFANEGKLFVPKIVKSVDGVGDLENKIIARDFIDKKYYDLIREGMKAAVEAGGTGYPLFDFSTRHKGIKLAGKTGTSEYIRPDGEDGTHAIFTVFGPYDDPNIVLTVFLEGGGGGADDAAPIAKELLDLWFE